MKTQVLCGKGKGQGWQLTGVILMERKLAKGEFGNLKGGDIARLYCKYFINIKTQNQYFLVIHFIKLFL